MLSTISSTPSIDRDLKIFFLAAAGVLVFMVVFINQCKVYDLATAAFVALGLGLMARGKLLHYLAMFAVANFNRETMFLLTMVFIVYFFWRLELKRYLMAIGCQLVIFCLARALLMIRFAANPGTVMLVRPVENLQLFLASPIGSLVHWLGFGLVLWLCLRRWKITPRLLQVAFAVMMPVLLILYLVIGWAFEIRVFAEVYPVVWVICNRTVTS